MMKRCGSLIFPGLGQACAVLCAGLLLMMAFAADTRAQEAGKKLPNEQLEQLVAPIALYPDSLLAQALMASTYPLEVVQADRWAKTNAKLKGKALEDKLAGEPWDASVKSLVPVPQVLTMMSEKLDWTQKLGDAFLAQQEDVLAAVQRLRARAEDKGTLKSTPQQKVSKQTTAQAQNVIVIEQANPEVVYVPTYDPAVVYGGWPYPAYPPYAWYPPGYVAGGLLAFGAGVVVGGALWGNCNWGNNNVNIDIDRYNNFNRTNISNREWKHDASHRKGVPYADQRVADRYGKGTANTGAAAAREQFRGRAESGNLGQGNRDGANRPQQRDAGGANRPQQREASAGDRGSQRPQQGVGGGNRVDARDNRNSQAFNGVGNGADARRSSERGQASRQGSQLQRRAAPQRQSGGGGRGGGGGGRGGGGRR